MAVKEWFRRLQPVQLYLVLFFTTTFFLIEIIASHVTHSLTLLLNAYHMLCNIVALVGCIASIKVSAKIRKSFVSLTYRMIMIIIKLSIFSAPIAISNDSSSRNHCFYKHIREKKSITEKLNFFIEFNDIKCNFPTNNIQHARIDISGVSFFEYF